MLEWIWVCMVLAFKAALGSFFWAIAIALCLIAIASCFGVLGSLIAFVLGGFRGVKNEKNK
jgi:hypothetical protein